MTKARVGPGTLSPEPWPLRVAEAGNLGLVARYDRAQPAHTGVIGVSFHFH